eukprot:3766683-Amphidinium_carterae.3
MPEVADECVELQDQYSTLEAEREAMHREIDDIEENFRVDVEGGAWSLARSSRLIAGVRALNVSASFSRDKFEHEPSVILAELWRFRLFKLWRTWVMAGEPPAFPTHSHVEEIPDELLSRLNTLVAGAASRRDVIVQMLVLAPWADRLSCSQKDGFEVNTNRILFRRAKKMETDM